jgi:hypothetical protein
MWVEESAKRRYTKHTPSLEKKISSRKKKKVPKKYPMISTT